MDDSKKNHDEHVEEGPQYGNEKESLMMEKIEEHDNEEKIERDAQMYSPVLHGPDDDVEFANDMAVDRKTVREPFKSEEKGTDMDNDVHAGFGWLAVILSIVSFFVMPVILGVAGIIVGFIARRRGAETLGMTAIIAGALSVLLTLFFAPF